MSKANEQRKPPATEPAKDDKQMAVVDQMPAYLQDKQGAARGRENVKAEDLVVPRLEIVQDLSPARKKSDPNYIPGAESGQLYNNVTRELYGESVILVPVGYAKEWLLWKDRKEGGGFGGAYPSKEEAEQARADRDDGDKFEAVDTGQQFCILVKPNGELEEIVVSMAKSKAKVSRKWNSLIRIANTDSFGRAYRMSAIEDSNSKNEKFYNYAIAPAGFPSEQTYRKAEAMYKAFVSGGVRADRSEDDTGAGGDSPDRGY